MSMPIVAIIGRPNVGKSTLFNKIVGKRVSIVDDFPGVTRDRIYAEGEWAGAKFNLIDTGGLEDGGGFIFEQVKSQAEFAMSDADVIIFVVDIKSGVHSSDLEISNMLKKNKKPVVLCVNKCDSVGDVPAELYEFYNLAQGDPFPVSSVHGHGVGDLLDEVISHFERRLDSDYLEDRVKVAIVGRPNAGKSSLINALIGQDRVIVSDVAGTTRDAIDTFIRHGGKEYVFIDTAGIRRKARVTQNIERYSVIRAHMAVDRADVCLIVIDALEGFAQQDSKIAGYALEKGKASVIAVNKWDLVDKNSSTMNEFNKNLKNDFSFMPYAPFIYISAKTGQRVGQIYGLIDEVYLQSQKRISTGALNEMLAYSISRVQPPSDKGHRLKIYYITQASVAPPTFIVFVNKKELFHFSYQRYLENQIRESFGFIGTPMRIVVRERRKED